MEHVGDLAAADFLHDPKLVVGFTRSAEGLCNFNFAYRFNGNLDFGECVLVQGDRSERPTGQ